LIEAEIADHQAETQASGPDLGIVAREDRLRCTGQPVINAARNVKFLSVPLQANRSFAVIVLSTKMDQIQGDLKEETLTGPKDQKTGKCLRPLARIVEINARFLSGLPRINLFFAVTVLGIKKHPEEKAVINSLKLMPNLIKY